jgi:hypothetical protein
MPDFMPNQELIPLVEVDNAELVDIISFKVIEDNIDNAKIELTVNNPSSETITDIQFDYISVQVLSQVDNGSKSTITLQTVGTPQKYLSMYYVKSITSVGRFGIPYTRNYLTNERPLQLTLYKKVNDSSDWNSIKNRPYENHKLTSNIDFINKSNIQIGDFYGILDGNNKTISNIEILSGNPLINNLYGRLLNLKVENYTLTSTTPTYSGLIGMLATSSSSTVGGAAFINNVHMNTVKVEGKTNVGALLGYLSSGSITNSSVTNVILKNIATTTTINMGALIGRGTSVNINNSYAQDIDLKLTDYNGCFVAGLVGSIEACNIQNCYVTGKINTSSNNAAGLVNVNNTNYQNQIIQNCITKVDIISERDYIGGIWNKYTSGINESTSLIVSNNLILGNMYTSYMAQSFNRILGNNVLASASNDISDNYALSTQLINGFANNNKMDATNLLTAEDLKNVNTYNDVIKFVDGYDYTGIELGKIPKLKYENSNVLLPNQKDIYIADEEFNLNIDYDGMVKLADKVTVTINIQNPRDLQISKINFDNLELIKINKNANTNDINGNRITTMELELKPKYYYDTYKAISLEYTDEEGIPKVYYKNARFDVIFYKDIGNLETWRNEVKANTYENYRLVGDIDFQNRTDIQNIKNLKINRLESMEGMTCTIKNINSISNLVNTTIFADIKTNIQNVNFNNVTLRNDKSTGVLGLINKCSGDIKNVNFDNINILNPYSAASTIIELSGNRMENINITNSTITSNGTYTGGVVARITNDSTYVMNIEANNINVKGASYTAGLIGYEAYLLPKVQSPNKPYNLIIKNSTITGTSYTAGLVGYGISSYGYSELVNIVGSTYVGSIIGYGASHASYNVSNNVNVQGSGADIGGMFGFLYASTDRHNYILNSQIIGTTATSHRVGAIAGTLGSANLYNNGAVNCTVISQGNDVGSIAGKDGVSLGSIYNSFSYNCTVNGKDNVGGIMGTLGRGYINNSYTNAIVVGSGNNVGGVVGYLNNLNMTAAASVASINNCYIAGSIEGYHVVGGAIGKVDKQLLSGFYSSIIVTEDVKRTVTSTSSLITASIGSNKEYANLITNLRAYDKLRVNGVLLTDAYQELTGTNLVTSDSLKIQATYTNIAFTTSNWDYTPLAQSKFPILKNTLNQTPINIPVYVPIQSMTNILGNTEIVKIPECKIYPVDVNKINIEFDNTDDNLAFKYNINNELSENYEINKKVFTFEYDFKTPFSIEITNGVSVEAKEIKPEDITRKVMTNKDSYYYIKDGIIKTKDKNIPGNYINIYNNRAIDTEGKIYNVIDNSKTEEKVEGLKLLQEVIPMFEFDYDNSKIKTYNNFTLVDDELVPNIQMYVKNNELEAIDSSLDYVKDSVIIDNYGNNKYLAILGKDGVIYNLKTPIKMPEDFKNKDIKYITNNIEKNNNTILVYYKNGSVYGFDYVTGEKIFEDMVKENISIFEYITKYFESSNQMIPSNILSTYEETKTLENKLIENPIESVLNNEVNNKTNNISKEVSYITVYNDSKKDFDVYNVEKLLEKPEEIIPENNIINGSAELISYYKINKKEMNNKDNTDGYVYVIGTIVMVLIGVGYIYSRRT